MIDWTYLTKVLAAQALLLVVYYLILDRIPMGRLKRGYLLAALAASFLIPLLPIYSAAPSPPASFGLVADLSPTVAEFAGPAAARYHAPPVSSSNWLETSLWVVYLAGVAYHLTKLSTFFLSVRKRLIDGIRTRRNGVEEVVLPYPTAPHTFLRWIFYGEASPPSSSVLAHECVHARQLHSVDRVVLALFCAAWWWNPLLYLYARCVSVNHELLADREVVRSGYPIAEYQQQILAALRHPRRGLDLASPAGFSFTKKRFAIMLHPEPSFLQRIGRYTLIAGLSASTILFFGGRTSAFEALPPTQKAIAEGIKPVPASPAIAGYGDTIQPPPPPPASARENMKPKRANPPSAADLAAWRDAEVYGVWVDGKRISNDALANYAPEDFADYLKSRLLANATNSTVHDFQVDLSTVDYFLSIWRPTGDGTYEWIGTTSKASSPGTGFTLPAFEKKLLRLAGGRPPSAPGEGC